jgi:hypothetical protein
MSGTDTYSIGNIVSDKKFDFINNINLQNKDDNYDNHLSFLDSDSLDSPYNSNTFVCNYVDTDVLCEQILSSNDLNIMSLNIQSLPAKYTELCDLLNVWEEKKSLPDIILLQEIWTVRDPKSFTLNGFQPLIFKCRQGGQGGGVGIYVKEGINFKLNPNSIFMEKVFESIFIDVEIGKRSFTIGSLYRCIGRHPTLGPKDQLSTFYGLLHNLLNDTNSRELVFGGDLNLDVLKIQSDPNVIQYVDTLFTNGCLQVVTRPTRCTNHSATCLDHFITNVEQAVFKSALLVSKISDHFPIFFSLQINKPKAKHNFVTCRDFSEPNINQFFNQLSITDWSPAINCEDAEASFNNFLKIYNQHHNLFFKPRNPRFNKNVHKIEKWMTTGLLTSRKTKLYLAKICFINPSQQANEKYNNYLNMYNKLVRTSKKKLLYQ